MAARIHIFLRNPPKSLESIKIQKGIEAQDWLTLGEIFKLEEDDVRAFMRTVQWHDQPLGFGRPDERQAQIELDTEPDMVRNTIDELGEYSTPVMIPERVRKHLMEVKGVVMIAIGAMQLRTMYETVAFEIAYWLAEEFNGLILSPDHQWYDHQKNRWRPIEN